MENQETTKQLLETYYKGFAEKSNWYNFVIGAVVAGWSLYIKIKEDL